MLVIAFHEFSHAFAALITGGRVHSISLDPHEGGVTHMSGGRGAVTLPAGYLGSSLIGALLTFCGFSIVPSKVASIALGPAFLLTMWWGKKDWLTILTVTLAIGLLIACWFIQHAEALRFVVLFIGVMSSLYSVWDICDDLILRKVNESDASQFAKRYGGGARCWGVMWSIVSILMMTGGIVAGLAAFPQSFAEQEQDSQHFLPTEGGWIFGRVRVSNLFKFIPRYMFKFSAAPWTRSEYTCCYLDSIRSMNMLERIPCLVKPQSLASQAPPFQHVTKADAVRGIPTTIETEPLAPHDASAIKLPGSMPRLHTPDPVARPGLESLHSN